jgi:hypothetical protein
MGRIMLVRATAWTLLIGTLGLVYGTAVFAGPLFGQ